MCERSPVTHLCGCVNSVETVICVRASPRIRRPVVYAVLVDMAVVGTLKVPRERHVSSVDRGNVEISDQTIGCS